MPVDLATADLLMGANNGPSASTISVADDLTDINNYGSVSSFGSVTATGVTLAEADNLPAGVDSYTLVDSVDGLQAPMPVDLATADLLMGANNGPSASTISVADDLTDINIRLCPRFCHGDRCDPGRYNLPAADSYTLAPLR